MDTVTGRIVRVTGPLVEFERLGDVAMAELVSLGDTGLPGEVVSIREGRAAAQAYEYTGGLAPGQPVRALGRPLSAPLGPWLLGGVFDGLLRPLSSAPVWLTPRGVAENGAGTWRFTPAVGSGDRVEAGAVVGTVDTAGPVAYRILVPPGVSGPVERIADPGRYAPGEIVAVVAGVPITTATLWPVRLARPYRARTPLTVPLRTGQRAVDLLFPIARGSSAAVPGGFGTGKTLLLQQIAKWCDADVIVYVGCGERGNEMADVLTELSELTDPRTAGRLADRTVIIANTSNMPMMAREASIYTGITVAEHFRDMGYHAVVIADSTSRWAEALREFASRTGALPTEEGYPANLSSALAAFYERAGAVTTLGGTEGSVTVIGAVSPPGGDMTEPVTTHTERCVRSRWTLDRDLAYARHYPAVSWANSFSRDVDAVARHYAANHDPEWAARRSRVVGLLADADRLSVLAELVGIPALPDTERIGVLAGRLLREGLLQQNALSPRDSYSAEARTAVLTEAILSVIGECERLVRSGIAAGSIEEADFGPLLRARDEAAENIPACRDTVLAELGGLS